MNNNMKTVTLELVDIHKIDKNIDALKDILEGKPMCIAHLIPLTDTLSLLKAIKERGNA